MSILNIYGGLRSMALVTIWLCSATSEVFPSLKGSLSLYKRSYLGVCMSVWWKHVTFMWVQTGSNIPWLAIRRFIFEKKHWSTLEPHLEAHDVVPSLDFQIQRMKEKREPLDGRWMEMMGDAFHPLRASSCLEKCRLQLVKFNFVFHLVDFSLISPCKCGLVPPTKVGVLVIVFRWCGGASSTDDFFSSNGFKWS